MPTITFGNTSYSYDSKYDKLTSLGVSQAPARWTQILSGSTDSQGTSIDIKNFYVSGASPFTYIISTGANSGATGTSTAYSLAYAYNHVISNAIAVDGGSLAIIGNGGRMYGATALYNASIEAVGSGVISGGVVGSSGAIFAGAVSADNPNLNGFGTVLNPVVGSAGYALVGGGGNDFIIKGFQVNGVGGLMSGGTFNPGSLYGVGNGGVGTGGTIFGSQAVFSNGTSINQLFVGGSSVQIVVSNGLSSNATILGGTLYNSGGSSQSPTVASGGLLHVIGGTYVSWLHAGYKAEFGSYGQGTTADSVILNGGTELVGSDGSALRSIISSGGIDIISGGTSISPTVKGGTEFVTSGGTVSNATITSGGSAFITSSSLVSGLTASSQGYAELSSGAIGSEFVASSGGSIQINNGGTVNHLVMNGGAGGVSGGIVTGGATINSPNSRFTINNGGTVDYVLASAGTAIAMSGASVTSGMFAAGTTANVVAAGASISTMMAGSSGVGGTVTIGSGGVVNSISIQNAGTAIISNGGTLANILTVSAGAASVLSGGQFVSGATVVASGGTVVSGGRTSAIPASVSIDSGNLLTELDIGSSATASIINRTIGTLNATGGVDTIGSGASILTLNALGGTQVISSGGFVSALNAQSGGTSVIGSKSLVSSLTAASGASITISSGATVPNVMLSGATLQIPTGGAGVQVLSAVSGATGVISAGAKLDSMFLSSAKATVASGVFISKLTILSGASGVLMPGATVQNIEIGNGGWVSGATVSNNSELIVSSGGTAIQSVITYDSGTTRATTPASVIQSGGVVSNATIAGATGSVNRENLGGLLTVESGATLVNTSMGYNARIKLNGMSYDDQNKSVTISGNTLTVTEKGQTWSMSLAGSYDPTGFVLSDDGQGNSFLIYQKCFLAGSMIRTPKGEKAVERLRKGEQVCIHVDGREETREITGVIQRRARVDSSKPEDMAGWSVIIAKDAFGKGLPNKDLSVTPEHCFYFEGKFVPVRMLVNGTSIRYDHSQVEYDYYHVKTEPHSIIWANGVLTESWLDTDEQDIYQPDSSTDGAMRLVERQQLSWNEHAAAPLDVSQDFVKPLHTSFADRAKKLGLTKAETSSETLADDMTADPAPYIRLDDGRTLRPQRHEAGRYLFALPAHARRVVLGSRTFRPSESVGPHLDDRRELGMLVGQVSVWAGGQEHIITRHLTEKLLEGWDVIEAGPHRWTKGEAELLLHDAPSSSTGQHMLSIEVQAGGPYRK